MGLLDGILGKVVGQGLGGVLGQNSQYAGLVQNLLGMLTSGQGGGLSDLLGKLKAGGLGNAVGSWISTGPNQPVTGEQLQGALPADLLSQLAAKTGMDPAQASQGLAQVLPGIVDKLTPDGALPDESSLQSSLGGLAGMFSGKGG